MRRKSKKPSRPHPSQRPSRLNSAGHIMTPEEQKKEWSRKGLCTSCGMIQISRKTSLFGMKREVLTIPGKVYKGICLQCNTLQYAMAQSGEIAPADTTENMPHRSMTDPNITSSPERLRQRSRMEDTAPARVNQRGMSREQNDEVDRINDTHEHGVPRDVGPRMGGLQKQVSDITLDTTMLDLDVEPRTSLSERNFNTSLGDIVEDESSHNRDALRVPSSTNNRGISSGSRVGQSSDSRVGVFSSEGGAMERLEARIRAKSDANSHHVHFNGPAKKPAAKHELSNSLSNSERSDSGISISRKMNRSLGSSKTEESVNESSKPGTAVNIIGDRLNIYEERIRRKNAQSSTSNEVHTERIDNVLLGGNSSGSYKQDFEALVAQDRSPGNAIEVANDRLNIYEERIRRKKANDLSHSEHSDESSKIKAGDIGLNESYSEGLETRDIPSRRHRTDRFLKSLVDEHTPFDRTAQNERSTSERLLGQTSNNGYSRSNTLTPANETASTPGVTKMQGDVLNLYERRINQKSKQISQSHDNKGNEMIYATSSSEGLSRSNTLTSANETASTPGVTKMQGDVLNLYERRINQKSKQISQSHVNKGNEMICAISSREGLSRSNTLSSANETASTPGVTKMQGDVLNLYERRINQKSKQISQSNDKSGLNVEQETSQQIRSHSRSDSSSGMETADTRHRHIHRSRTNASEVGSTPGPFRRDNSCRLNYYDRKIQEKEALSRHASIESSSSDQQSTPGAFQEYNDNGRQNIFEQRIRQKNAARSDNRSTSMSTSTERQIAKASKESSQSSTNQTDYRHDMILQRKIHRGNSESRRKHHGYHSGGIEGDSHDELNSQLLMIKDEGNCDDVIAFLRPHSDSLTSSTTVLAFQCIIDILMKNYNSPSKRHLFRSKVSWLKPFSSLMYTHFSNEIVQAKALESLWSIASYSVRHSTDIITNDEIMESIVDGMECHQSETVNEFGSGLIWCLATGEKSSSLLEHCDGQIVQRLVAVLTSNSCTGSPQLNAIRALFCLSTVFDNNCDGFFGDFMGQDISDERVEDCASAKSICAILDAMHQHSTHLTLLTDGTQLLCALFTRDTIGDDDVFFAIVEGILDHIETMCSILSRNCALDAALVSLLSHISTYCSDTIDDNFPFSKEILSVMSTHTQSETVALHGCRFIYNICAGDSAESKIRQAIGDSGGIEIILDCLTRFDKHIDVLGEACGAIFACCCKCSSNKTLVTDLGGVMAISVHAFDADYASLCSTDEDMLSLNIRACAALITLAIDPAALQDMQRLGIIERFESCLENESLDIPGSLRSEMKELVTLSLHDDASFDNNMSANETHKCLFMNLKAVLAGEIDRNSIRLLQTNTIGSMRTFRDNNDIQELGCKLLACTFGTGNNNMNGLEATLSSIESENASLVAAAASAVRNFCLTQTSAEVESYESYRLHDLLVRSVDDFIEALSVHKNDDAVVEQVTSALWAISTREKEAIMSFESTDFTNELLVFVDRSASINTLHCSLGILHMLFSSTEKTMDFLTNNLISSVIKSIKCDDEKIATAAISTMHSITERGAFPARMMILDNHHELLIGAVVEIMFKFPGSSLVIRSACDIFSNISLDNYYRSAICNMGGIGRINESLHEFRDEKTICKALISLTNLMSGCDADVLQLNNVANNIISAMQLFQGDLYVQLHGASAIWHLASRDDLFKEILVDIGAVKCLSDAMTSFIRSEKMTRKGVVALWSLSVPRHLKAKVAQDGFAAVVNGMSAHVSSEQASEEGLGALKSMSTAVKQMTESNDALDLIYSCMWLHSHNPAIQEACLAALVNLSVDTEKNQVSQISLEDLETIAEMMRIHQDVKAVQENAIILLKNFTFSPHNCLILQQNTYLASLIRMAMINFHETFQGRAENLLRVLPPTDSQ